MNLTKKQEEVIRNKSRFKVLNWGRRSGKTTEFAYEALGTALTIPNAHITYYAQTFGDARDIAWNIFLKVFGEAVESKNETLLEIKLNNLKGGTSLVSLKGWESVYQAGKGRGTENDLILADEVAFCRQFIEFYDKVLAPTLLTTKGRAVFGSTPNGFNDFFRLTRKAQSLPDWFYSHATSYDNHFNDPKEIERIASEIPEDRFAQEYLADFRKLEGLVYKEFDYETHVFNDLNLMHSQRRIIDTIAGLDFGFTNPTALLTIEVDQDRRYFVTKEWYKTGKTNEEIIEYAKTLGSVTFYPDPAEPDRISEMQRKGLNVREVNKDVEKGIDTVRNLLKQKRLFIHKDCTNLIAEFETYRYKDRKEGLNEPEEPLKEHDHALDALRYALYMKEPEPLEDLALQARILRNRATNLKSLK